MSECQRSMLEYAMEFPHRELKLYMTMFVGKCSVSRVSSAF